MQLSRSINQSIIRASAAAMCLFGSLAPAIAQGGGMTSGASGGISESRQPATFVDLDFHGGTATQYIEALREAAGDQVNVVVMEFVGEVTIPQVRLRSVDFASAIGILQGEENEDAQRLVRLSVRDIGPELVGSARGDAAGRRVYKVTAEIRRKGPNRDEKASNIWSVADLLQNGFTVDEISTAISSALDLMFDGFEPASVRFHEETGLIMAHGQWDEVELIENVIEQLRVAADQRSMNENDARRREYEEVAQYADQARQAQVQIEEQLMQTMRELEMTRARSEIVEQEMQSGSARLQDLQTQLQDRDRMVAELQAELANVRNLLIQMQNEADKP